MIKKGKILGIISVICMAGLLASPINFKVKADQVGMQTPTGIVSSKISYSDKIPDNATLDQMIKMSVTVTKDSNPELFSQNMYDTYKLDTSKMNLTGNIYHQQASLAHPNGGTSRIDYFAEILSMKAGDANSQAINKYFSSITYIDGTVESDSIERNVLENDYNSQYYNYLANESSSKPVKKAIQVKDYGAKIEWQHRFL